MTVKHTPGPWEIDWYICRGNDGKELWRVPRSIGPAHVDHNHWAGLHITVDEADAHLIAAAPTMYEALKQIEPILTRMYGPQAAELPPMQIVRAAIAKAEGA